MHVIACRKMNMGEAEVEPKIYATDHHGVAFMLQVRATHPRSSPEALRGRAGSPDTSGHPFHSRCR